MSSNYYALIGLYMNLLLSFLSLTTSPFCHRTKWRIAGALCATIIHASLAILLRHIETIAGEVDFADIVENVGLNEELYDNIEWKVEQVYRLNSDIPEDADILKWQNMKTHIVLQDGMLYLSEKKEIALFQGPARHLDTEQAYNGEVTRIIEQNGYANIRHERFVDDRVLMPHYLPLSGAGVAKPLSKFMSLNKNKKGTLNYDWRFVEQTTLDGMECMVVRVTARRNDDSSTISYIMTLWLAIERNYLPVKWQEMTPRFSKNQPTAVAIMSKFREVEAG